MDDLIGIFQRVGLVAVPEIGARQCQRACIVVEVAGAVGTELIAVLRQPQRVVAELLVSGEQVADDELHGLLDALLRHDIGSVFRDVGHAFGFGVRAGGGGEETHQVEMEEGTESVSLAAIDMIVIAGEAGGVGLVDIADEDIEVGDAVIGVAPYLVDGALACRLRVVEVVGVAPFAVGTDIVGVGEDFHEADAHVLSVHLRSGHGGIHAGELVFVSAFARELLVLFDLRLRFHVEPVVACRERHDGGQHPGE